MRGCIAGIGLFVLAGAPVCAEGLDFLDGRVFVAADLCSADLGAASGYADFMQMAGPYVLFGGPSGRTLLPTGYPGSCVLARVIDDNLVGRIEGGPASLVTLSCTDPGGEIEESSVVVEYDPPSQVSLWPMGVAPEAAGDGEMFRSYFECDGTKGDLLTDWFIDTSG